MLFIQFCCGTELILFQMLAVESNSPVLPPAHPQTRENRGNHKLQKGIMSFGVNHQNVNTYKCATLRYMRFCVPDSCV